MRAIRVLLGWVVVVGLVACGASEAQRFENAAFAFDYPADWQLMGELWPNNRPQANYKNLGVDEIVTVTSVRKQGESGMWATVAAGPLDGSLRDFVERTYAETVPEIDDIAQADTTMAGSPAIELVYRRPWGEPWWAFRDIWWESDGRAYVLSFHALSLEGYEEDMDLIAGSLVVP